LTAADVPETAPESVRVWVSIIAIIVPLTTVVLAYLSNRGKSKAGMNAEPPEAEQEPEPRPPIVRADGEVDAAASVMQLYESMVDVHRRQQRSEAENQRLKQQLFEMKTQINFMERHHRTATQQILTWAVNLSGNPPHPVPVWVSELVESARQA
jgi:hypothetical protein